MWLFVWSWPSLESASHSQVFYKPNLFIFWFPVCMVVGFLRFLLDHVKLKGFGLFVCLLIGIFLLCHRTVKCTVLLDLNAYFPLKGRASFAFFCKHVTLYNMPCFGFYTMSFERTEVVKQGMNQMAQYSSKSVCAVPLVKGFWLNHLKFISSWTG